MSRQTKLGDELLVTYGRTSEKLDLIVKAIVQI